jgi:group I intron endonuclease
MANVLGGIYCIENSASGKRYIGSSINLAQRQYDHFKNLRGGRHHSIHLQRAFEKYGGFSFNFRVLMLCEPFELLRYEQALIDSWQPEYNICLHAGNSLGRKHTEATKKKISNIQLVTHNTPEFHAKASKSQTGKKRSDEFKQKVSLANSGKIVSEETRNKHREFALRDYPNKITKLTTAKLTPVQVFDIRKLRQDGKSVSYLSKIFHISLGTIRDILKGRTWQSL